MVNYDIPSFLVLSQLPGPIRVFEMVGKVWPQYRLCKEKVALQEGKQSKLINTIETPNNVKERYLTHYN